jgi:hypothetical protein
VLMLMMKRIGRERCVHTGLEESNFRRGLAVGVEIRNIALSARERENEREIE